MAEPVYCYQCHMNIAKIGHTASCPTQRKGLHHDGMTWLDWFLIAAAICLLAVGLFAEVGKNYANS